MEQSDERNIKKNDETGEKDSEADTAEIDDEVD